MREGGHPAEVPLVAKWHQGEKLQSEYLGGGFEAEVHRETYETSEGAKIYAYKDRLPEEEVRRSLGIYQQLQEAGLPVVSFMKTRFTKDANDDKIAGLVMEDVTQNGAYTIHPAYDGNNNYGTYLLSDCKYIPQLEMDTVRALAIMHNNKIYDFHPGISFFFRQNQADTSKVDFVILDYSNLADEASDIHHPNNETIPSFDEECERDLKVLLESFPLDQDFSNKMKSYYKQIRMQGIRKYA